MSFPKTVDEQEKAAEDLIKKLQAGDEGSGDAGNQTDTGVQDPPAPGEPIVPDQPGDPKPDEVNLEQLKQRLSTLEGKYNAETAPALRDLSEARKREAELRTQIAVLTSQINAIKDPPKPDPRESALEQVRTEAPEVISTIEYFLDKKMSEIDKRLEETKQKAEETSAGTFFDRLGQKVTDWEKTNEDPAFLAWLSQTDRYSGAKKMDLLRAAVSRKDLAATSAFFEDFRGTNKTPDPGAPIADPRGKFASPPKPGSSGAPRGAGQQGEPVSREFILSFYSDHTKGRYRGREKEAAEIEAKINAAIAAGNIT